MSYLQTIDVTLRAISDTDATVLLDLNNDPETAKCVVGNPRKVTMQEQIEWMKNLYKETDIVRFMVDYKSDPVGTVIISDINNHAKTANMAIKLLGGYRGIGIGKKALLLAIEHCFCNMDLFCLTAHVLEDNLPSQSLFEKVGFVKEGVLRARVVKDGKRKNLLSYSLLCSEYKKVSRVVKV